MRNLLEAIKVIFIIIGKVIKYILFDMWKQLFSRLFICQLKDHDWYFIGGGWIFTSKYSFRCKRCGKCTNNIGDIFAKLR